MTSKYASTTHCRASNLASNSTARVGKARLTALESSVAMKTLLETTAMWSTCASGASSSRRAACQLSETRKLDQRAGESFRVRGG